MQLERRGFYPQGGGRAALTVQSLAPGSSLAAFDLTDRGSVTSITVRAFQAGQMKPDVAERMASAAVAALQKVPLLCPPPPPPHRADLVEGRQKIKFVWQIIATLH